MAVASLGGDRRLAETLADIAALPYDACNPDSSVRRAVELTRAGLGVGGVLLRVPGFPVIAEGCAAVRLLELEDRLGEGPSVCPGPLRAPVVVADGAACLDWPRLADAFRTAPPTAFILVGVGGDAGTAGRLVAIDGDAARLRGRDCDVALAARVVGAVLARDRALGDAAGRLEQLRQAMASRAVIEQAKGMIMMERRCGEPAAFAVLAGTSQRTNVKLRVLAGQLVESRSRPLGEMPRDATRLALPPVAEGAPPAAALDGPPVLT